jgi:hypothetical protein
MAGRPFRFPSTPVRRALLAAVAALLTVQGVRLTLAHVVVSPTRYRTLQYDPGLTQALRAIEAAGRAHEGIMAEVVTDNKVRPVRSPAAPALLGRPVRAAATGAQAWTEYSRPWLMALDCPSPVNLRAAGLRWVVLDGEGLARAVPLVAGLDAFERFGGDGSYGAFRVYRYGGTWEVPSDGLSDLRSIQRFRFRAASLGEGRLAPRELQALMDGRLETCVPLDATRLEREGLTAIWEGRPALGLVWLALADAADMKPQELGATWVFLDAEGRWTAPAVPPRAVDSATRPGTFAFRIAPLTCCGLCLRLKGRGLSREGVVRVGEFWAGAATEHPPWPRTQGPDTSP